MLIEPIGTIVTDFGTKFGVPRQAGLVPALEGKIVLEKKYRNADAFRGLEGFSHVWLIWGFSENLREDWSPTVRPPRLGGNVRLGVFATRSPFRPNNLGLSCVELDRVDYEDPEGPVVYVRGADLMNGTPVYDIKPYIPYADCKSEATEGFAPLPARTLSVEFECETNLPPEKLDALRSVLELDPRPHYQADGREYGFEFAGREVRFRVENETVKVLGIE